jgi:hypothetical protein
MFYAKCDCGFDRELSPGATLSEYYVIAYTAEASDLITIEYREAERANLTVIEDPYLKEDPLSSLGFDSLWGPYRCPGCKKLSLQLSLRGYWD